VTVKRRDASTPGPWNAEHVTQVYYAPAPTDVQECIIVGNNLDATENDWIALVPHTTDEDVANARLIAAAPSLLSAVRNMCGIAKLVESCWESGDLAGAVRAMGFERRLAEAIADKATKP
jgi:hypothetical protein